MVGDWAERDIIGAKKVGMKTVFARYGDTFNTEISGGDYEANDIQELIAYYKERELAMVEGVGIDIIEVSRIQKSIEDYGFLFTGKIFTERRN